MSLPELSRTSIRVKDISEQPDSEYVVIVGGDGGKVAIAIDAWWVNSDKFTGYRDSENEVEVVSFGSGTPWLVCSRDIIETQTREQYLRSASDDNKSVDALLKEIDPDAVRYANESIGKLFMIPAADRGEPEPDSRPMPGTYL